MHYDQLFHSLAATTVAWALVSLPFALYCLARRWRVIGKACGWLLGLLWLENLAIFLPALLGLEGSPRVWVGKNLEFLVFLALARALRLPGLAFPRKASAWPVAVLLGVALAGRDVARLIRGHLPVPEWEFLAFQMTLPGMAEEVCFRLVLLGMLTRILTFRWAALLSSLMFCLAHTLWFDAHWKLGFTVFPMADYLIFAFCMCWLRHRYESIWPCVLAHNLTNCIAPLLGFLL